MKKVDKYYTMYIGYTELTRRYTHKAFNIQETTFIFFVVCCSWHNYLWLLLQERWCTVCYRDLPKNKKSLKKSIWSPRTVLSKSATSIFSEILWNSKEIPLYFQCKFNVNPLYFGENRKKPGEIDVVDFERTVLDDHMDFFNDFWFFGKVSTISFY